MKVYKIWDVAKVMYRTRSTHSTADQSCWESKESAKRIAGRMRFLNGYEIHTFHLQRVEE